MITENWIDPKEIPPPTHSESGWSDTVVIAYEAKWVAGHGWVTLSHLGWKPITPYEAPRLTTHGDLPTHHPRVRGAPPLSMLGAAGSKEK